MSDTQSDPIRSDVIVLFWAGGGGGGWAGAQQKVGTIAEPSSESRLEFISSSLTLQFTRSQTERGATQQTTLQRRFHEEGGEKSQNQATKSSFCQRKERFYPITLMTNLLERPTAERK